jgi:hypothetical protein
MSEAGHTPAPGHDGHSRTAMAIGIGISVGVLIAAAITAAFVIPILKDDDSGGGGGDGGAQPAPAYTSTKMECTPGTFVTRLGVVFPGPEAKEKAAALKQSIEKRAESYKVDVDVLVSDPADTCDEGTEDKEKQLTVLYTGPFQSKEDAQAVCTSLKYPKEDCYVRLIEDAPQG